MIQQKLQIPRDRLASFCRRNHIRKMSLFGSVLRKDFGPDSDLDVLVEFEPGQSVGFIRLAGMEIELSDILGRKVDLRTPADLSRYFRQEVLDSAEVQYAEG
ncbi:MAG: nucleotidyltransferase family protein [Desulfobacterales bacterium]|nr:nucleotidyltransferase family protein [Desulfobacterales bacterium]